MKALSSLPILLSAACALVAAGCVGSAPRFTSRESPSPTSREPVGYREVGVASYYGDEFDGKKTSNGETYDMHGMTAAHRTLPFNAKVRVTHRVTGRSVIVRINDRGPFKDDRIIDLSYAAARQIGLIGPGTGEVVLEVIEPGDQ